MKKLKTKIQNGLLKMKISPGNLALQKYQQTFTINENLGEEEVSKCYENISNFKVSLFLRFQLKSLINGLIQILLLIVEDA